MAEDDYEYHTSLSTLEESLLCITENRLLITELCSIQALCMVLV